MKKSLATTNPGAELVYLASPYSHKDSKVRKSRVKQVAKIAKNLIMDYGYIVYSPIAETSTIQQHTSLKNHGWDFWKGQDLVKLSRCDKLVIATMEGWCNSRGIRGEIKYAIRHKIPIAIVHVTFPVSKYEVCCKLESISSKKLLKMMGLKSIKELND